MVTNLLEQLPMKNLKMEIRRDLHLTSSEKDLLTTTRDATADKGIRNARRCNR